MAPTERGDDPLRATLAAVAPGTALRDGLERILRGHTGALIVLGYDKIVEALCTGGFALDVEFSATRLRELAKMDGAHRARPATAPGSCGPPCSWCPTRRSPPRSPAPGTAPPSGSPSRPASRSSRSASRCASSRSTSTASATCSRTRRDPVPGQPGAGHPGALQAPPRRGGRHAVRAGDRGPGHRPRRLRGRPAAGDGAPDRRRDRGVRRRARHRRPAALPAARRADRRRRARPRADRPRLPAGRRPAARPRTVDDVLADLDALDALELLDLAAVARALGYAGGEALDAAGQPARLPAAGQGAAAARAPSSTGWSSTSAACRSCSPPASTTCRRSTASARRGPAASARACPGWPSPRSSSATSDRGPKPPDHERVVLELRQPGHRDHADRADVADEQRERPAVRGVVGGRHAVLRLDRGARVAAEPTDVQRAVAEPAHHVALAADPRVVVRHGAPQGRVEELLAAALDVDDDSRPRGAGPPRPGRDPRSTRRRCRSGPAAARPPGPAARPGWGRRHS